MTGDEFLGLAYKKADNTVTGHTAGGMNVRLHQSIDIVHALSSVAVADISKDVYALDDSTAQSRGTFDEPHRPRGGRARRPAWRVRIQPAFSLSGVIDNQPIVQLADADATLTLDHINRTLLIANTARERLGYRPWQPRGPVRGSAW